MENRKAKHQKRLTQVAHYLSTTARGYQHVIDRKTRGEGKASGKRIDPHAAAMSHEHPRFAKDPLDLARLDESLPAMSAARKPTKNVLSADNGEKEGERRAIDGGNVKHAALLQH